MGPSRSPSGRGAFSRAPNTAAQQAAQKLVEGAPVEQREALEGALGQWHVLSGREVGALRAEGLTEAEAIETVVGKVAAAGGAGEERERGEAGELVALFEGTLDEEAARRVLRMRREITALRERGMERAAIVREMLGRLEKPAGYKRAGRSSLSSRPDHGPLPKKHSGHRR